MSSTQKKRITILGATGTIGQNTLDLISRNRDSFEVVALTGNKNIARLASQAIEFNADFVAIPDESRYCDLKDALAGSHVSCGAGPSAILEAASRQADICMAAIVGTAGLEPTLKAMEATPTIALANKECLVSAGRLFMARAEEHGVTILPVDSEHAAAFQCLQGEQTKHIEKLTLTASGGPFRTATLEELSKVVVEDALKHPNWEMGAKITIDSATLMNKGLELIEAKYLFNLQPDQLDMVVHPQSIIHCLLHFQDGSVLAQMSTPDMRVPIAYSLAWPERMPTPIEPLDLTKIGQLTFEKGDNQRFPCLALAQKALYNTDELGPILNAANEIAVEAFLSGKIAFQAIPALIEEVLSRAGKGTNGFNPLHFNDILEIDAHARKLASDLLINWKPADEGDSQQSGKPAEGQSTLHSTI